MQLIFAGIGSAITVFLAGAGAVIYVDKKVGAVRTDIAALRNELLGIECPFRRVTECEALRAVEACAPPVHARRRPATAEG